MEMSEIIPCYHIHAFLLLMQHTVKLCGAAETEREYTPKV